jgi:23S rRNA (adenine2030-N6)-methyltransferase
MAKKTLNFRLFFSFSIKKIMHSYQHHFHAGNYADIFKHLLLITLVEQLQKKEKGLLLLDTHAGRAIYYHDDVNNRGVKYFYSVKNQLAAAKNFSALDKLFSITDFFKAKIQKLAYPGSSSILALLQRPQDRLISIEQQGKVFLELKQDWQKLELHKKNQQLLCGDGYQALGAYLPPVEKRSLIFIDPPYDQHYEFRNIIKALGIAHKRFASGVYAIWYPLLGNTARPFLEQLQKMPWTEALDVRFWPYPKSHPGMYGCGLLILNPPWPVAETLLSLLDYLQQTLGQHPEAGFSIRFLEMQKPKQALD